MPTGYTADVQEGKVTDFAEFAITCARGMGALIMLRDHPAGEPVPDILPTSGGHVTDRLKEAKARLSELEAMSPDVIAKAAAEANAKAIGDYEKRQERVATERARYESMIAKTQAWKPPTKEHADFKKLMLDQLHKSLDLDVVTVERYGGSPPTQMTPDEWHSDQITKTLEYVAYCAEEAEKARLRDTGRQTWWDALRASLSST